MKYIKQITYVLIVIGALNWGIYGLSGFNLVDSIFNKIPVIARIIYVLVGLSAVYSIFTRNCACKGDCMCCKTKDCSDCSTCSVDIEVKSPVVESVIEEDKK